MAAMAHVGRSSPVRLWVSCAIPAILTCERAGPSAERRGELDDVVVVVLEEAQAAVDRLEVDGVAEDLDAAGTKLGERRVDVGDVQAEVVVLLDAEAVVERVDRGVGLGCGAAEDLDLGGAVAEVGELHVAERPLLVDREVELVLVPRDGASVVDGADGDMVVAEFDGHGLLLSMLV